MVAFNLGCYMLYSVNDRIWMLIYICMMNTLKEEFFFC